MSHRNAPLTAAGRLRLVERCQYRPIAHVAAEAGLSRQCLSKWVNRYCGQRQPGWPTGPACLTPRRRRRAGGGGADRGLASGPQVVGAHDRDRTGRRGHRVSAATVGRWFVRLGINRRRDLDPDRREQPQTGHDHRPLSGAHDPPGRQEGRPDPRRRWLARPWPRQRRGPGRPARQSSERRRQAGYVYLHSAVDGFSRLAYTEHLPDETAATTIGFFDRPARSSPPTASAGSCAWSPTTGPTTVPPPSSAP